MIIVAHQLSVDEITAVLAVLVCFLPLAAGCLVVCVEERETSDD